MKSPKEVVEMLRLEIDEGDNPVVIDRLLFESSMVCIIQAEDAAAKAYQRLEDAYKKVISNAGVYDLLGETCVMQADRIKDLRNKLDVAEGTITAHEMTWKKEQEMRDSIEEFATGQAKEIIKLLEATEKLEAKAADQAEKIADARDYLEYWYKFGNDEMIELALIVLKSAT